MLKLKNLTKSWERESINTFTEVDYKTIGYGK